MTILELVADGVWMYPYVFGHSKQLSQNKFFDPSTPSLLVGDHPWWVTILGFVADGSKLDPKCDT